MSHFMRSTAWLSFFAAILGAWAWLYMMATGMGLDLVGRPLMPMGGIPMGGEGGMSMGGESGMSMDADNGMAMEMDMAMDMTRFSTLFAMWAVMMAAMMLPTMVPTLRSYEDLMSSADGTRGGWFGVLVGYFVVWVAFAAGISVLQIGLLQMGLIDVMGIAQNAWIAGLLLIIVGAFQFTRAKEVCHGVCHSPMSYFLGNWRTGPVGGFRMGLGLGAFCVGCCWGFMALGFVGGVMSLLWMGLATLFMVVEKLPQIGHYVTKPMGFLLIFAGFVVIAYPLVMGV